MHNSYKKLPALEEADIHTKFIWSNNIYTKIMYSLLEEGEMQLYLVL